MPIKQVRSCVRRSSEISFEGRHPAPPVVLRQFRHVLSSTAYANILALGLVGSSLGPLVTGPAVASDLYWNPDHQSLPTGFGGSGVWSSADDIAAWSDSTGSTYGPWEQGSTAHFTGVRGEVSVLSKGPGDAPYAAGLSFESPGFIVNSTDANSYLIGNQVMPVTVTAAAGTAELGVSLLVSSLVKDGDGELVISSDNFELSHVTINAGTLKTTDQNAFSSTVSIAKGATWELSTPEGAVTLLNNGGISGAGSLVLDGAGQLTLLGRNSFSGDITVNSGKFYTTDYSSINSQYVLVTAGGTLSGFGTIFGETTISGGAITAGFDNHPGAVLNFGSSLTISPGSQINVAVSFAADTANIISVLGNVYINGGEVLLLPIGESSPIAGEQFVFLRSLQGNINQNGSLTVWSGVFNQFATVFTDKTISIQVNSTLREATCEDLAFSGNRCGVVEGLRSLPDENALFSKAQWIGLEEGPSAIDQLSGDIYPSVSGAMVTNSRYVREATKRQIRASLGGIAEGAPASSVSGYAAEVPQNSGFEGFVEDNSGIGVWATGYGAWSRIKGDGNAETITDSVGGMFLGADFAAGENMRFGGLLGYGQSSYDVDARDASATSDDFTLGLYGGGKWGGFGADFGLAYIWHDVSLNRSLSFSTLSEQVHGEYDAGTFQVYGGLGYAFDLTDEFQIEPFADAAYINQYSGDFSESGGLGALIHPESTMNTTFTTLGLRGAWDFNLGQVDNTVTASAGWRHGFGDLTAIEEVRFGAGDPFSIAGAPIAEDQFVFGAGWQAQINEMVSVGVNYSGQFGGGNESQDISAHLNIRF